MPCKIVGGIKSSSFHGFDFVGFEEMCARMSSNKICQQDPELVGFVERYRDLPLVARAKLENWHIDIDQIRKKPDSIPDNTKKSYWATYHGLDVHATVHDNAVNYDASEASSLYTEITAMVQVRHPNVIGFLGVSISDESYTVVTEMPLGSLRAFYLSKQSSMPSWRPSRSCALVWSLDLLRAVNYLHQSDPAITHRDLCPDTVFIASSGVLKISGFGRCSIRPSRHSACGTRSARSSISVFDAVAPPPPRPQHSSYSSAYTAPELQRDPACADETIDVFAAAMLIAFIHTARDPKPPGARPAEVAPSAPWRALGLGRGAVAAAVAQAGAEDPAARPSADELTDRLEALQGRQRLGCRVS